MLVGGGHAQLAVLADCIRTGLPCERVTLLSPHPHLRYSGTVPGWIAGQYSRDEGLVDIAALARRAGVTFNAASAVAIDSEARTVTTDQGEVLSFDLASIDTGGVGQAARILGDDPRLLDVRPIGSFVDRLEELLPAQRIAVIGGGAGGVELAFALRNSPQLDRSSEILFVTGDDGLLPGFSPNVVAKVEAELARQGLRFVGADARIEDGQIKASRTSFDADIVVAALGSGAPSWPGAGGLACDEDGFVAVDRYQRSTSHPHIFAAGDVAARTDRKVTRSGVNAVHAGPVLAANLRAVLAGKEPRKSYAPRAAQLYLISTGRGEAIASYGRFAWQARLVARLKHVIDMRWLASYAKFTKG
ncbi:MAG: FAD-dependent oxidoreductase [Pseudomonadota bacterium]